MNENMDNIAHRPYFSNDKVISESKNVILEYCDSPIMRPHYALGSYIAESKKLSSVLKESLDD